MCPWQRSRSGGHCVRRREVASSALCTSGIRGCNSCRDCPVRPRGLPGLPALSAARAARLWGEEPRWLRRGGPFGAARGGCPVGAFWGGPGFFLGGGFFPPAFLVFFPFGGVWRFSFRSDFLEKALRSLSGG